MNCRTVIFNGIMTALIGAMIGLAVATISQREIRTRRIVTTGAILGFAIGAAYEGIRQQKRLRSTEYDDSEF